jgi:hypothetical protein
MWFAIDEVGQAVRLQGRDFWDLLAITGNEPCNFHGEWNGRTLRLLAAWGSWGYLAF